MPLVITRMLTKKLILDLLDGEIQSPFATLKFKKDLKALEARLLNILLEIGDDFEIETDISPKYNSAVVWLRNERMVISVRPDSTTLEEYKDKCLHVELPSCIDCIWSWAFEHNDIMESLIVRGNFERFTISKCNNLKYLEICNPHEDFSREEVAKFCPKLETIVFGKEVNLHNPVAFVCDSLRTIKNGFTMLNIDECTIKTLRIDECSTSELRLNVDKCYLSKESLKNIAVDKLIISFEHPNLIQEDALYDCKANTIVIETSNDKLLYSFGKCVADKLILRCKNIDLFKFPIGSQVNEIRFEGCDTVEISSSAEGVQVANKVYIESGKIEPVRIFDINTLVLGERVTYIRFWNGNEPSIKELYSTKKIRNQIYSVFSKGKKVWKDISEYSE